MIFKRIIKTPSRDFRFYTAAESGDHPQIMKSRRIASQTEVSVVHTVVPCQMPINSSMHRARGLPTLVLAATARWRGAERKYLTLSGMPAKHQRS